jgi:hypothetical protein
MAQILFADDDDVATESERDLHDPESESRDLNDGRFSWVWLWATPDNGERYCRGCVFLQPQSKEQCIKHHTPLVSPFHAGIPIPFAPRE